MKKKLGMAIAGTDLAEMLKQITENNESNRMLVGELPKEISDELRRNHDESNDFNKMLQRKVEDYAEQLERENRARLEEIEEARQQMWRKIEALFGKDKSARLSIDKSGRVYEQIDDEHGDDGVKLDFPLPPVN